jgi:hypothetical protein
MSMDDASLSEHEQRVLEEIEKHLLEEDPEYGRRLREATPRRDSIRLLRLSVLAVVLGLAGLAAFTVQIAFGALGFLLMLAGCAGIAVSVRTLASGGRAPGAVLMDALKRAESRIRRPPRGS